MLKQWFLPTLVGGILRYYLATTQYGTVIANRVEISTPLNSFKRMQEGVYLFKHGINPYQGDMVHEMPLILLAMAQIFELGKQLVPFVYILADLITALLLYKLGCEFVHSKLQQQKAEQDTYAADTEELHVQESDLNGIARCMLLAYLFNPLSVLNCAGLTSTVFSNLFLALMLYFLQKRLLHGCLFFLAVETMRNLYPIVLIAPVLIVFKHLRSPIFYATCIIMLFGVMCSAVAWLNYYITQSWSFIDGTLGFIFFYRDLQPNVGLFWYFFTEMFDHFRTMFLVTFQMNATVLYLLPLSFKLRKEPLLLATVLIALMAIFRSYPCLGDVSFYLALLLLWRRCWKFMAHNFVVFSFFVVTLSMLPALWHLWIYAGSANANFYFGTTLAFSTGQIFLVTDLLFAHLKREFCLRNGQKIYIDGKEAKIILE